MVRRARVQGQAEQDGQVQDPREVDLNLVQRARRRAVAEREEDDQREGVERWGVACERIGFGPLDRACAGISFQSEFDSTPSLSGSRKYPTHEVPSGTRSRCLRSLERQRMLNSRAR